MPILIIFRNFTPSFIAYNKCFIPNFFEKTACNALNASQRHAIKHIRHVPKILLLCNWSIFTAKNKKHMDDYDDLGSYNGDVEHGMWVDYDHYRNIGELNMFVEEKFDEILDDFEEILDDLTI